MMKRRVLIAVFATAAMGTGEAMYGSSLTAMQVPVRAMFAHEKTVHFGVKNETSTALKLKCGEELLSVAPGQTAQVKLPVGTKVTFVEASGPHAAGDLLAEAAGQLNGTTISVRSARSR